MKQKRWKMAFTVSIEYNNLYLHLKAYAPANIFSCQRRLKYNNFFVFQHEKRLQDVFKTYWRQITRQAIS